MAIYRQCGFGTIRLVEPDPGNLAVLASRFGDDDDIDGIEALPSTEVETGASAVSVPMILPDSVVQELEVY